MRRTWTLISDTLVAWASGNALEWGAALAYYTAFSIAPLLMIALSLVGLVYKGDSLAYVHAEVANMVGANAAAVITSAIRSIRGSEHGTAANVISVIVLLLGASSVFGQLQNALNRVWGVQPKPGHYWRDLFRQRLISFALVLGISFVLLVSLLISAALAAITAYFQYLLPGAGVFWELLDPIVSFAVVVMLFAVIFKVIPDVHIDWADVWMGAIVTGVLFVAGKTAIGFYIGRSGIGSAYGAAGSVMILLAWVYYSSQILFLGAEFTKHYAEQRRFCVRPVKGAAAVTPDAKQRERGLISESGERKKAG